MGTTLLKPAWEMFGDDLVINFKPFGKANWTENGNTWDFICQHGPDECFGNKVQACILAHEPYEASTVVPLIDCLMRTHTKPDPVSKVYRSNRILNFDNKISRTEQKRT